jgi:hypothetical protein
VHLVGRGSAGDGTAGGSYAVRVTGFVMLAPVTGVVATYHLSLTCLKASSVN